MFGKKRCSRVVGVSMKWLLAFLRQLYQELPEDLHLKPPPARVRQGERFYIQLFDNEAEELWSFVGRRKSLHYVWVVMHRQIIAFQVGDRSRQTHPSAVGEGAPGRAPLRPVPHRRLGELQNRHPPGPAPVRQAEKAPQPPRALQLSPCASASAGWSGRHSPSPRNSKTTSVPSSTSSATTTWKGKKCQHPKAHTTKKANWVVGFFISYSLNRPPGRCLEWVG
jgi:hypothetical protein